MGAREKKHTQWSEERIAKAMEKLAESQSYSDAAKALGVSKGSIRSLAIRNGFALEKTSPVKAAATSKPKPKARILPISDKKEGGLSQPAIDLLEKITRLTATEKPLSGSVQTTLEARLKTIAVRVTNIHPDLKTMPANVREVLKDCIRGVIGATDRSNGTQIILPPLPPVLTSGAALNGVQPEKGSIATTSPWSSRYIPPSSRNNTLPPL
jgi:hypothetical protein